jgi:hypothetical protein
MFSGFYGYVWNNFAINIGRKTITLQTRLLLGYGTALKN